MARIALVQQGDPTDPASWSGVPARLVAGFEAAGCTVAPVRAQFPGAARIARLLHLSSTRQAGNRAFAAACGMAADRALARIGGLDGVVMIGSEYALSTELPTVTFEDMTVALALGRHDPVYEDLSEAGAKRWRARQQLIYERNRGCCVASHWAAASVRDDYDIQASKIHVVGVGRNVEAGWVERDWSVPHFLFVGADWERKRGAAVVESFAAVRELHPEATLDLVGGHPPIEAENVSAHGTLPLGSAEGQRMYADLIRRATCFLMPSTYEPFGIAYVDAGASGLPSIGTTVGGAPDAVGDAGIVVDPDDPEALTAAMLRLSDPATARALGKRAYERSNLFTWQAVAERLLRALHPAGIDSERLPAFLDRPAEIGGAV